MADIDLLQSALKGILQNPDDKSYLNVLTQAIQSGQITIVHEPGAEGIHIRSMAVGGDISGSTVITGDKNIVIPSLVISLAGVEAQIIERIFQSLTISHSAIDEKNSPIFLVERLPNDFVLRSNEIEAMISCILNSQNNGQDGLVTAFCGAGGYGKTILALAVCHDSRIREAFPDGIIEIKVGLHPDNLVERINSLIECLTTIKPGFTDITIAASRLADLLETRKLLLLIDDVWESVHLKPFLQGGKFCTRLITTRNISLLPDSTIQIEVNAMEEKTAIQLLGNGLPEQGDQELAALAARLGYWPILLRLAKGALRNRLRGTDEIRDALLYINRLFDKRGLTAFDNNNSGAREEAVAKTIGASLDLMTDQERARFEELAVFPENIDIPLADLTKLWNLTGKMDDIETQDLCARLDQQSLISSYDPVKQYIRLHDVVHQFLTHELGKQLPLLHNTLLKAYQLNDFTQLQPNEPYLWKYVAYHLYHGERYQDLFDLVEDRRWYESRLNTNLIGYLFIEDLKWATRAARSDMNHNLGHLILYSFYQAQIKEQVSNYPISFSSTLANLGQIDQALNCLNLLPDYRIRALGLCTIAEILIDNQCPDHANSVLEEAVHSLKLVRGEVERTAFSLPGYEKETESTDTFSGVLFKIVELLGKVGNISLLQDNLDLITDLEFRGAYYRPTLELLSQIARSMIRSGDVERAFEIVTNITDHIARPTAREVDEHQQVQDKVRILIEIAEELLDESNEIKAREAIDRLLSTIGRFEGVQIIAGVSRIAMWNGDFNDAREIIDTIDITEIRQEALSWLAYEINNESNEVVFDEIYKIARFVNIPEYRKKVLQALVYSAELTKEAATVYNLRSLGERLLFDDLSQFYGFLVRALANKSDWEHAEELLKHISNPYWKGCALVDIATSAQAQSETDLAIRCLEKAELTLSEELDYFEEYTWQHIALTCMIVCVWAKFDTTRGQSLLSAQNLQQFLNTSSKKVPYGWIARAYGDIKQFETAFDWARQSTLRISWTYLYIAKQLLSEKNQEQAVDILIHALDILVEQNKGHHTPINFYPSSFTESTWENEVIFDYQEVVRLLLQIGGRKYFKRCLEVANQLYFINIPLLASLESITEDLHWEKEQQFIIAEIVMDLRINLFLIPEQFEESINAKYRNYQDVNSQVSFFLILLDQIPSQRILHRYLELTDEYIRDRLRIIEQTIWTWAAERGISLRRSSRRWRNNSLDNEDVSTGIDQKIPVDQWNRVVCALADRFARFHLYPDALSVCQSIRPTSTWLENRKITDITSLSRLAALTARLGDRSTAHQLLELIIDENVSEIPRGQLFGLSSEALIYAGKAAKILGSSELINALRDPIKKLLGEWLSDPQQWSDFSEPNAGAIQYIAPFLATINDSDSLGLALEFSKKIEWGDDQAACVVAIAKAMSTMRDHKGLKAIFEVAQNFEPQNPQGWFVQWSKIVDAILVAQSTIGDAQVVIEVANWLKKLVPAKNSVDGVWIEHHLAQAICLLSTIQPERCSLYFSHALTRLQGLGDELIQDANNLRWLSEERDQLMLAHLELAKAYWNLNLETNSFIMLHKARNIVENQLAATHDNYFKRAYLQIARSSQSYETLKQLFSWLPLFSDDQFKKSVLINLIDHFCDLGDISFAKQLLTELDGSPNEIAYCKLQIHLGELRTNKNSFESWFKEFLTICSEIRNIGTREFLLLKAANILLDQNQMKDGEQIIEYILSLVEQNDDIDVLTISTISNLIELLNRTRNNDHKQHILQLILKDNFRGLSLLSCSDATDEAKLPYLFFEKLIQHLKHIGDKENLRYIADRVSYIGDEQSQAYDQHKDNHYHPLFQTRLHFEAKSANYNFEQTMKLRHSVAVWLAKAFAELNDKTALHQLAKIPIPFISRSEDFILEFEAIGSISYELLRLEGDKGIQEISETISGSNDFWKPIALANLAWASYQVIPGSTLHLTFLQQAITDIDLLLEEAFSNNSEFEYRYQHKTSKDSKLGSDLSNVIAVVAATAARCNIEDRAIKLFDRSVEIANDIYKPDIKDETLNFIVRAFCYSNWLDKAHILANSIPDLKSRDVAWSDIVEAELKFGYFSEAIETASHHNHPEIELISEISEKISAQNDLSIAQKAELINIVLTRLGTRNLVSFWQCFRSLQPVFTQIGGESLIMNTWYQLNTLFLA